MEKFLPQPGDTRLNYLVDGYVLENLEEDEYRELNAWIDANKQNLHLFEDMAVDKISDAILQWETIVTSQKPSGIKEFYN